MTPSATPVSSQFNAALFNQAVFGGGTVAPGPIIQLGHGLLYPALRKAAITLGPQRTPSPAQFQDAIEEINRLIGSLNCDRLFIYDEDILTFPLQAGKKIYTIGVDPTGVLPAADFPVPAPIAGISEAVYIYSPTAGTPLRYPLALLTSQMWSKIRVQDIANTIPQAIYYDRGYPIGNLYIYGQPQGGSLELYLWHRIPYAVSLADVVTFPPGYEDALVLNLAVRLVTHFPLAPNVPRQVDPNLYAQARESMMRLESINAPMPVLDVSFGCGYADRSSNPWFTTTWGPQG